MRLLITVLLAISLLSPVVVSSAALTHVSGATRSGAAAQDRRVRRGWRDHRRRGQGIGSAYRRAGSSAGRGGARFGKNIGRGRPVRAGKHLGKGVGGFGKHSGVGTARVGKKVGRGVKRIF